MCLVIWFTFSFLLFSQLEPKWLKYWLTNPSLNGPLFPGNIFWEDWYNCAYTTFNFGVYQVPSISHLLVCHRNHCTSFEYFLLLTPNGETKEYFGLKMILHVCLFQNIRKGYPVLLINVNHNRHKVWSDATLYLNISLVAFWLWVKIENTLVC